MTDHMHWFKNSAINYCSIADLRLLCLQFSVLTIIGLGFFVSHQNIITITQTIKNNEVLYIYLILNVLYSGSITARPALEWYYIVGPMSGCIVIFAIGWYISKRRRAGKNTN